MPSIQVVLFSSGTANGITNGQFPWQYCVCRNRLFSLFFPAGIWERGHRSEGRLFPVPHRKAVCNRIRKSGRTLKWCVSHVRIAAENLLRCSRLYSPSCPFLLS